MSNKLRVAVVGAGAMANRVHYPSLTSFPDVEISGICDINEDRLRATSDRYEVEGRYTDYRVMIEASNPDAVYAIGQPESMYDVWCWCLEHGLNLYIEKPMGTTIHQARSLAYLAEKNGCITQVSFQRRACPLFVQLLKDCRKSGPIVHAQCAFFKHDMTPCLYSRDRMMNDGVHAIDTLRWICGGEVIEVHCVTKRVMFPDINFIAALLVFDTGATGMMTTNWTSGRRVFKVEMHSPGVCAEAEQERKGYMYSSGNEDAVEFDARTVAGSDMLYVYGGFQAKSREFIDAVRQGVQPASNFSDAVKTMEVAERILAQSLLDECVMR
jgi:virulence factor